jgi:hypothetical protein
MNIFVKLIDWLLANFIIPLAIPFIFAFCAGRFGLCELSEILYVRGFFTFASLTLLISLFQDYRNAKDVFKLTFFCFFSVVFLITAFNFIDSLADDGMVSFFFSKKIIVITIISTCLLSIIFKYQIIRAMIK